MRRSFLTLIFACSGLAAFSQQAYNILNYGAKSGLNYSNTLSIQHAIDAAASNGGGKVVIPAGNFITGPVILKSNVELHLANDAVLLGSAKRLDYSEDKMSIISAQEQHNIAVTGNGIIDGQGRDLVENTLLLLRQGKIEDKEWLSKRPTEKNRPNLVYFKDCRHIRMTGITLKNAASWVQNYKECDDVVIDSMKVHSTAYWNNDGIDIVDSKNVKITNSYFNASDDAICLKSENPQASCENISVENCTVRSSASGFKLGTGSVGGFKNITVKNLTVFDTYRSAIALETVDGAYLQDVDIRHVVGKNTGNAIFIRLGHRNKDAKFSSLRNIFIDDVKVEVPSGKPDIGYPMEGPPPKVAPHNLIPASIVGLPGHPVQNVTLQNIEIIYGGGAKKELAYISTDSLATVTENAAGYPEFTMFGELPAWGLYIRHTEGIRLSNIKLSYKQDDFRPALIADDVKDLSLKDLNIPTSKSAAVIVLNNVINPITDNIILPVSNKDGILIQKKQGD
jgi:polygalacturonase